MTEGERAVWLERLKSGRDAFVQAVCGLSESQARFKTCADRWSIEEIVEHVAITERHLLASISQNYELVETAENEVSSAALNKGRDRKASPLAAPERLYPAAEFGGLAGALEHFFASREATIQFVQGCEADLRLRMTNHPLGRMHGRDVLKIVIGHPARHLEQIAEVKAAAGYPS